MPKISGLGLGEIKKASGLGLGPIKKISGTGLGLLWQDQVIQTIIKNGDREVATTDTTVTGWLPDAGSAVLNDGLLVPVNGTYSVVVAGTATNAYMFGPRWIQLSFYRNGFEVYDGPEISIPTNTANHPFSMTDPTPRALSTGDYINLRGDAQSAGNLFILGGTYLRITSID